MAGGKSLCHYCRIRFVSKQKIMKSFYSLHPSTADQCSSSTAWCRGRVTPPQLQSWCWCWPWWSLRGAANLKQVRPCHYISLIKAQHHSLTPCRAPGVAAPLGPARAGDLLQRGGARAGEAAGGDTEAAVRVGEQEAGAGDPHLAPPHLHHAAGGVWRGDQAHQHPARPADCVRYHRHHAHAESRDAEWSTLLKYILYIPFI